MAYLLDSNVFIQAKNLHYGFGFCPAFWDWIDQAHRDRLVYSIRQVKEELLAGQDDLADWARRRPLTFFLETGQILNALRSVSAWIDGSNYERSAKDEFLRVADYHLVATALARRYIVVSHETPAPSSRSKIKIPDVSAGLGVECTTVFDMLRVEEARFVLSAEIPEQESTTV